MTYGIASTLPWAVDFGDGIRRHPTQLYEIAFLIMTGILLWNLRRRWLPSGSLFRLFMASYLFFRFGVEFLKPRDFRVVGLLSPIQVASLAGAMVAVISLRRILASEPVDLVVAEGSQV
jgi:prolipoprotein diacylglyceryltransferase